MSLERSLTYPADGQNVRYSVVLADDDARVRDALTALFDDHPLLLVVGTADSGTSAAAICGQLRPDLAVVDVIMPTGGVEAVELIHAVSPKTRVVGYTARRDRRTRERLLASGAVEVFTKGLPIDLPSAMVQVGSGRPVDRGAADGGGATSEQSL